MHAPHVICGGGLAGLALAVRLARADVGEVVVLERTVDDRADRTWCTWDLGEHGLVGELITAAASARWQRWAVATPDGQRAVGAGDCGYVHLAADAVRAHLTREARAAGATIRRGVHVLGIDAAGGGAVVVTTSDGPVRCAHAYDALALTGPAGRRRAPGHVELHQRFLGLHVRCARPTFDPDTVTLMEFLPGNEDAGARFVYVLPFSSTEALVEDTSFGGRPVTSAERRQHLHGWLAARGAGTVEVVREERGDLLMTDARFWPGVWPRHVSLGAAAGALRPSSGYAFTRTLRHVDRVADAVIAGAPTAPDGPGGSLLDAMDAVMLRVLVDHPAQAPAIFRALIGGVDGDALARFMADAPLPADLVRVMRALPPRSFVRAAMRTPGALRALPPLAVAR